MNTACVLPSQRRVNGMYCLIQMAYWAMFAAVAGFQAALLLSRGFSSGYIGIFASLRCLSGIIFLPLLCGWADRHSEVPLKRIFSLCMLTSLGVSMVLCLTRPGFFGTALIYMALGALELNAYPLLDSMAVQFLSAGIDVKYSLGRGLGSFSYAVACVLLGRQATALGVESLLLTHAVLLLFLLGVTAAFPSMPQGAPGTVRKAGEAPHSVWFLLRSNRSFSMILAASFFCMLAVMPAVSFMTSIITAHGGDNADLGVGLFLMASAELPAAVLFPHLCRRLGNRGVLVFAFVFMAMKPVLILLAPSLFWVMAVQPIQLLGYGLFTPASVFFTNENIPAVDRIRGQSIMMVASNGLGGAVGNLLGGAAIDLGGVSSMLTMSIACGMVGVLLAVGAVLRSGSRRQA